MKLRTPIARESSQSWKIRFPLRVKETTYNGGEMITNYFVIYMTYLEMVQHSYASRQAQDNACNMSQLLFTVVICPEADSALRGQSS